MVRALGVDPPTPFHAEILPVDRDSERLGHLPRVTQQQSGGLPPTQGRHPTLGSCVCVSPFPPGGQALTLSLLWPSQDAGTAPSP